MTAIRHLRRIPTGLVLALSLWLAPGAMAQTMPDFAVPAAEAAPPLALPPRPDPDPGADLDAAGLIDRTAALYTHFRSTEPPLDDRVIALDIDPARAFALIRDTVHSIPYDGHLRATEALLAAGSGNAVDKSLALADVLARMGYDVRLVQGDGPSPAPTAGPAAGICGPGAVDANAWQLTGLGPDVLARVPLRAQPTYGLLHGTLSPADAPDAASIAPHVWVQMRDGADWVDLDPWLPDTAFGEHPAGTGRLLDQPPAPHAVSVALRLETLRDGALQQSDILRLDLDVPDAADALVFLTFAPETGGIGGTVANVLETLDGSGPRMLGLLYVNDQSTQSRAFAAPGQLQTEGGGFLSDGGTDGDITTALFLEVTSHAPGQPDHTETRTIIDIVPPFARLTTDAPIAPSQLLPVTQGRAYPAALESLRQIVLSNGGTSRRMLAALTVDQVLNLGDVLTRADQDALNAWDLYWSTALEARRIALAAEEILRARPAHDNACAANIRPRVMIWGLSATGTDALMRWLDWTIDDIAVLGGTPMARAETRLWHGALQAALEKEALMRYTLTPDDAVPIDRAAMEPLSADHLARLGAEPAADAARGYVTLANADMPPQTWWRVDPVTGSADARGQFHGNTYGIEWGAERAAGLGRTGPVAAQEITAAQQAYNDARTGQQLVAEINQEMRAAQLASANQPTCGGNEYMILGTCVSIRSAIATGSTVTIAVVSVLALFL